MSNDFDDVTAATALVLRAALGVLFEADSTLKEKTLSKLSAQRGDVAQAELLKLYEKAESIIKNAS